MSFPVSLRRRLVRNGEITGAGVSLLLASTGGTIAAYAQQPDVPPTPPAITAPAAAPSFLYTRDEKDKKGQTKDVQTAIRRFNPANGTGPTVYLVAAVHIGEKSYYQQLQQFLNKQDVVLYEGVKPARTANVSLAAPTPPPLPGDAKAQPVMTGNPASIQKKLSEVLNLQFQLDGINYRQPNFRNSDLYWDDMEALATKAGSQTKTGLTELKNTMSGAPGAGLGGTALTQMVDKAGTDPAFAKMLRGLIIQVVANPAQIAAYQQQQGASATTLQSVLITERNKVVLANVKDLMDPAKADPKKPVHSVAVFFGAEHMYDMEKHLVNDLGYRPADAKWVTAINADPKGK